MGKPKELSNDMQIMFWATMSDIYDKMKDINNIKELRDVYDNLWDNVQSEPIKKQAIKYFYLFRKSELEGNKASTLFETRNELSDDEIKFYESNLNNKMSLLLLNRLKTNNKLSFEDNVILHLGSNEHWPVNIH